LERHDADCLCSGLTYYLPLFCPFWTVLCASIKASRLNSACNDTIKASLDVRLFGYQDASQSEIDSYIMYMTSHGRLRAVRAKTDTEIGCVDDTCLYLGEALSCAGIQRISLGICCSSLHDIAGLDGGGCSFIYHTLIDWRVENAHSKLVLAGNSSPLNYFLNSFWRVPIPKRHWVVVIAYSFNIELRVLT
jgi:hypothetical protein